MFLPSVFGNSPRAYCAIINEGYNISGGSLRWAAGRRAAGFARRPAQGPEQVPFFTGGSFNYGQVPSDVRILYSVPSDTRILVSGSVNPAQGPQGGHVGGTLRRVQGTLRRPCGPSKTISIKSL